MSDDRLDLTMDAVVAILLDDRFGGSLADPARLVDAVWQDWTSPPSSPRKDT
ncbi:hypothetical protein GCM10010319_23620 [Streptomyces blastmyceticus]|uniref:Uncharacterized protein n=1 Tax=Streptomyces blastmyceticus TaxID=68180 RepID=A0ABP3GLU0_9ACTN